MDYEKKYKEALEKARAYHKSTCLRNTLETLENIFPELKESEDERIRKAIIEFFENCNIKHSDWIAWLEKQGERMSDPRYYILDKLIEADDIYQMSVDDAMAEEAKNKAIDVLSKLEISKLLGFKKQGEQKSFAKYKVGDILVSEEEDRRHIYKVDAITNYGTYLLLDLEDGYTRNESVYICDIAMHLWTIQDAKDGDVLVTTFEEDNMILMYHSMCTKDTINVHCCLDNKFTRANLGVFDAEDVKPATKEQRDLLFQKMKESGYEWNHGKK